MLSKYNIKLYHTKNQEKSAIVERFNRTLNGKMKVEFEYNKNKRWIDMLQDLVNKYNNTVHRTIGMKPIQVNKNNLLITVYNLNTANANKANTFKIGDRVRISTYKRMFENNYTNNWTREIFVISKIQDTCPIIYKIQDSFYKYELLKTSL